MRFADLFQSFYCMVPRTRALLKTSVCQLPAAISVSARHQTSSLCDGSTSSSVRSSSSSSAGISCSSAGSAGNAAGSFEALAAATAIAQNIAPLYRCQYRGYRYAEDAIQQIQAKLQSQTGGNTQRCMGTNVFFIVRPKREMQSTLR